MEFQNICNEMVAPFLLRQHPLVNINRPIRKRNIMSHIQNYGLSTGFQRRERNRNSPSSLSYPFNISSRGQVSRSQVTRCKNILKAISFPYDQISSISLLSQKKNVYRLQFLSRFLRWTSFSMTEVRSTPFNDAEIKWEEERLCQLLQQMIKQLG